jgi:hypothetical protein
MKKVVLQRDFKGQDSWMAYKEQVAIDENNNLDYRRTNGGICGYGDWREWKGEKAAIEFVFGDLPVTDKLLNEFKKVCQKATELKGETFNLGCY